MFESVDDNAAVFLNGKRHRRARRLRDAVPGPGAGRLAGGRAEHARGPRREHGGGGRDQRGRRPRAARGGEAAGRDGAGASTTRSGARSTCRTTTWSRGRSTRRATWGTARLPKPLGYYRKTFTPPRSMKGKSVWIDFDGVYRNAAFYLNGEKLGTHSSGYIGVRYDLSQKAGVRQAERAGGDGSIPGGTRAGGTRAAESTATSGSTPPTPSTSSPMGSSSARPVGRQRRLGADHVDGPERRRRGEPGSR